MLNRNVSSPRDGLYTERHDPTAPVYNLPALFKYCDAHGVEPYQLPEHVLKQFEVRK